MSVPTCDESSALTAFRETLLQPTLENALRTGLYRSVWHGIDTRSVSVRDLARLPMVDKAMLRAAGRAAQAREGLVCDEIFTSGTTGPPFVSVRGHREQEFIQQFFTEVFAEFRPPRLIRGLQINNPYHGHQVSVPAPVFLHKIGIYDRGSFDHAHHLLTEPQCDSGVDEYCTVLMGLERTLQAFAHYTLKRYPEGIHSRLQRVTPYAQYLTRRARQLFERAFRCRVLDRFGMSEVFGGASESAQCGWYHFDPCVIPEVVLASSRQPITEGIGVLLLTSLFPFQEAQPMVRYHTGDLVEVTHTRSSRPGELAIRPLGRARYGVPSVEPDEWLLVPAQVYEVVDAAPQIRRSPLFRDSAQVEDPAAVGHPRYNSEYSDSGGKRGITINIEVVSRLGPRQRDALRSEIHEEILRNSTPLKEAISRGRADLRVMVETGFAAHFISYAD